MQYIMNILAHCIVCSVGNRSSIPGFFFFVGGRGEGWCYFNIGLACHDVINEIFYYVVARETTCLYDVLLSFQSLNPSRRDAT